MNGQYCIKHRIEIIGFKEKVVISSFDLVSMGFHRKSKNKETPTIICGQGFNSDFIISFYFVL